MTLFDLDLGEYQIRIQKKHIKHIYFKLDPRQKELVVSVPFGVGEDAIHQAVLSRYGWIKRRIQRAQCLPEPVLISTYTDETAVPVWGKKCRFKLENAEGRPQVDHSDGKLVLRIGKGRLHDLAYHRKIVETWYRRELTRSVRDQVEKWQPVIGVGVREYRVRKMRTRWGSCNTRAKRIWLNLALIHLEPAFLEYVVIHEMVHLLEPGHNKRFRQFMNRFLPHWPQLKHQLDRIYL